MIGIPGIAGAEHDLIVRFFLERPMDSVTGKAAKKALRAFDFFPGFPASVRDRTWTAEVALF